MAKKFNSTIGATLSGIKAAFFSSANEIQLDQAEDLRGKTCLITGSSSGLGFAAAKNMAKMGADLMMAVRSGIPQKGEEVKKISGSQSVKMEYVDLADFSTIDSMILRLKEAGVKLDVVVFNAGMFPSVSRSSDDGLDLMFKVNYLSTFYLVHQLIEHSLIKLDTKEPARFVFVSSESHRSFSGEVDLSDFGKYKEYTTTKVIKYYGYYKFLLNAFIVELNRRLTERSIPISVFALCPGAVNTNIARESPSWLKPILWIVFGLFFQSPHKASAPILFLSASRKLTDNSNVYVHMKTIKEMSEPSYDTGIGKRVWGETERLLSVLGHKIKSFE